MESSALFARLHDCTKDSSSDDEALAATYDNGIELIKDRVSQLGWEDMERLVAGMLKAMGYCARVTPKGPDGGRDVIASPDALGLESPRIVAEVKHRKGAMGAPAVRSFIGGLRAGDRGLYVSTGGFTREARYEADRANVPVRPLDLDASRASRKISCALLWIKESRRVMSDSSKPSIAVHSNEGSVHIAESNPSSTGRSIETCTLPPSRTLENVNCVPSSSSA